MLTRKVMVVRKKTMATIVSLTMATTILGGCGNASSGSQTSSSSQGAASTASATETTSADSSAIDPATQVAGKRWIALGDSLTEKNSLAKTSYYDYAVDDLGCVVENYGKSATGYKEAGPFEPFYERVAQMDLANTDCVTVFGSFNDLGKGFELGTAEDETTDTIGGCMNQTMQRLVDGNPQMAVGIVTPTRWLTGFGFTKDGKMDWHLITREECDAYVQLLKDVAARHGLPVLDLYNEFSVDPDNEEHQKLYYGEGDAKDPMFVHPNSEGHKLMYPLWREFIIGLMTDTKA